jgi:hypothetical protein
VFSPAAGQKKAGQIEKKTDEPPTPACHALTLIWSKIQLWSMNQYSR